jgi:hypothetical protein
MKGVMRSVIVEKTIVWSENKNRTSQQIPQIVDMMRNSKLWVVWVSFKNEDSTGNREAGSSQTAVSDTDWSK